VRSKLRFAKTPSPDFPGSVRLLARPAIATLKAASSDDVDEIVRIGAAALGLGRDGRVGFGLGHGHLENCAHEN
jgi:hypothetical protein